MVTLMVGVDATEEASNKLMQTLLPTIKKSEQTTGIGQPATQSRQAKE
jgi:hypothetical protein